MKKHIIEIDKTALPQSVIPFYDYCIDLATIYKVQVRLLDKRVIKICDGGDSVYGFFAEVPFAQLNVACKNSFDLWFPVMVHESCHMEQCYDNVPVWRDGFIMDTDASSLLDLWLLHKIELTKEQCRDIVARTRDVEVDCERRVIEKIKEFNLPIDPIEYTQKANAYAYFYTVIQETREWPENEKESYEIKEIWSRMPKDFNNDYSVVTGEVRDAFRSIFPNL